MADASGEDVTSQGSDAKLGLTTFSFRSQRYQIPSVIVKEENPDDPSGEDKMCVVLDVGFFCPHCSGPCKELYKTHGQAHAVHAGHAGHIPGLEEGYHSLERQVQRSAEPHPRPVHQVLPNRDARSLQESLAKAMAEHSHSRTHGDYSASEPWIGPSEGSSAHQKQYKRQHSGENTSSPKVTVKQTFEQQQGSATDSPKFTVRHSVKQSSASYSSSSPVPKPKPIPKPKPRVKPKPQVSNGQGEPVSPRSPLSPVSPPAHFSLTTSNARAVTSDSHVSPTTPNSTCMSRSDYGSMDRSPNEDIEVAPMPGVGNLIKKFSTSDSEASVPASPKSTPTSPQRPPDWSSGPQDQSGQWMDQRGAAKFIHDIPITRQTEDVDMLRAFGFHVYSQPQETAQRSPTSPVAKITRLNVSAEESSPARELPQYRHAGTKLSEDYQVKREPTEEDIIKGLLQNEDITSDEEFLRNEFLAEHSVPEQTVKQRPPMLIKKHRRVIPQRVTSELSGSSDVLSADSEAGEDVIGLEKDILGDSLIGNVSEQPMLHEESPEANVMTVNGRERAFSGSDDELDNMAGSGMDASECETGEDESIRSVSPEIDLDIALESAETEVFSNDATLGRVFSVRSEKRQYSLVKIYSRDKKSKSRDRHSKQSSSSSMENILEEEQQARLARKSEKEKGQSRERAERLPSPDTVFEDMIESLGDSGERLDWTSDYESDQKDYPLRRGQRGSQPRQNGVMDVTVDSEINSLDFLGGSINRRTSSCECVVDHLTQDTESSLEPTGSSIGTREDTDFSPDEYGTESDASDPKILDPGDKSVEEIIDNTRYLTDSLLATLEPSPEMIKKVQEQPVQRSGPPPVPKRSYVFCETSFVGSGKPSHETQPTGQEPTTGSKIPDMDKIYIELSEREKKRESPPKELLSLHRTTTKEPARAQETLYAYDEVCAPKSPVIHRTPVYAKIQRIPQFLAEEFAHTITNEGDTMQLESERMQAAQYQNYQQELEKRIPEIEVCTVPSAPPCSEDEVDTTDIDKEFEDNLKVCSHKRGDDVSSDLGSIIDGMDGDSSSRENLCESDNVAETEQSAPVRIEENAQPETIKHAYQAATYVTKMVEKTPRTFSRKENANQEKKKPVVNTTGNTSQVDNWNRATSDASNNVSSFSSKDSLTREQAQQFIQTMMGNKTGGTKDEATQSNLQASLSQVCKTSSNNKQVAKQDEEVISEEVTTQEVTLVFSWPNKKGMPIFPNTETPYKELFLHRVTRISDNDKEVIEGPTIETIEYGKSQGIMSGIEYERQKGIKAANTKKALPSSIAKKPPKKESSTQSDTSIIHTSKFATDVQEVTVVSHNEKVTTVSTQTTPARIIKFETAELSLGAIKSQAESVGITVDATATSHTENIIQVEQQANVVESKAMVDSDIAEIDKLDNDESVTVHSGEEVVHELTSRVTTTTTVVTTTDIANDLALSSDTAGQSDKVPMVTDACAPSSASPDPPGVREHKLSHSSSSESSTSGSGSTGSIVDLHASQQTSDVEQQEYEETFPSNQELENIAEQQVVPPRFSEAIAFNESRDVNTAKVESQEQPSVVEEFFSKTSEPAVLQPPFCEQYSREDAQERKLSGPSDDKDLEGVIEGMQVVYPRDPVADTETENAKQAQETSEEPIEIRNVSMQHIMETLQRRMESLGYDLPMPDLSDVDTSKSKEQHLDLVWTEEDKRMLEETLRSSQKTVPEVKPKEVYEIDASRFFSSSESVEVSKHTETETKRQFKDVPLLTKVRLIAYMSDAERELIKSLIEFCRIIEQIGEPKISGRSLDVIPEGLELTVQPGVNYSDCLPSPESRKASQLHSPSSINAEDSTVEKAFEDTLAVIEKTKQFVNETDFSKPNVAGKPLQPVLRDTRTPSTDEDQQSAQCTNILELEMDEHDTADSSEEATSVTSPVRRVSVSGLYRDLIEVVMPLKTEKSVSQVTTGTTVTSTTETTQSEVTTTKQHTKSSNVIYETSFLGDRKSPDKRGTSTQEDQSQLIFDRDGVSSIQTVSNEQSRQVLHGNELVICNRAKTEHGKDMSSVTAAVRSPDICSAHSLELSQTVAVTHSARSASEHSVAVTRLDQAHLHREQSPHHISKKGDTMMGMHANLSIAPSSEKSSSQAVDHYAKQVTADAMKNALQRVTEPSATGAVTKIALIDNENRRTVDLVEHEDGRTVHVKKTPPPVPPRPKSRTQAKKEVLAVRPVFSIGSQDLYKDTKERGAGDHEEDDIEKIFLVRSGDGSRYETERKMPETAEKAPLNNRRTPPPVPQRTHVRGLGKSLMASNSSTEKIVLVKDF